MHGDSTEHEKNDEPNVDNRLYFVVTLIIESIRNNNDIDLVYGIRA